MIILSLSDSDYPTVPIKFGYTGSWRRVITPIHTDTTVYAVYTAVGGGGGGGGEIIIPPQPTSPGEIMSGGEGEPVEADVPAEDETVAPQGMHVTGTQTVTHEYLTLNGKVARETIRTNNSLTAVLDFVYDDAGRPFALRYSTNGTSFQTYYYVLNLQGDVVKLIHYIPGFEYESVATYEYDAWGNIVSSSGRLAEINPLRYRGYYYDNETGFYYLQSRYYDPVNRRFINADIYASTDSSDAVSCNMFVYCGNNPVSNTDESGDSWFKALLSKAMDIVEAAVKVVQKVTSSIDVVISHGVTGNVSPGVSDFTFTAMVSADSKGNMAFQWQPMGGGITTNASPSASITATTSVTFAPDVTDLEGPGKSIGGSLFTPYYGLGGGLDFNIAEGKDRNYYGITTSAGVGTPSGEFHANWGETYPITTRKFNIYEALYNRIERIREWCAQ